MFENYTYKNLMDDVLENAPEGIDTRQGSIFFDAVSGAMLKVASLFAELETLANLIYIDTTVGEYLDRRAAEHAITRLAATSAKYYVSFEGVIPDIGERFYTNGIYFTLCKTDDEVYYLEAEDVGTVANSIYTGTAAIPVNNIEELTATTFGELFERGVDEEDDDSLRARLQEKIAGPAENGNRQHYRTWCEEVDGVGRARIIPLWNGPNTVKGVIIDPTGKPATAAVIARVQEYIDPDDDNDGEGDGLGEGVANIGAHFTAVAPTEHKINVSFTAVLSAAVTTEEAEGAAEEVVAAYLQDLTMNSEDDDTIVVRISAIGALINSLSCVTDYSNLTLNGGTENITPGATAVATIGEVTVNALQ